MCPIARHRLVALALCLLVAAEARGQGNAAAQQGAQLLPPQAVPQQGMQQAVPQQQQPPVAPQAPAGFQLNALQQQALDLVLDKWQRQNAQITTFTCGFERWEYDPAFGPNNNQDPLNKNTGELSYHRPDKGSFEIKEIKTFKEFPVPPGSPRKGDWVKQPDAIGDHWVCDGTSVYQYRPDVKQIVEHPIPPQLQGQAIVDGPLPFLFGADAAKLKQRYWLKLDQQQNQDNKQVWIIALPKFREQAADFREVDVILDSTTLLPLYMQVWMPNGSHHMYKFDIANAQTNGLLNRLQGLFTRPATPFGWKRVVENVPLQQAERPVEPPR